MLEEYDLGKLDAIVVKKLSSHVNAAARLRLHMLHALEGAGVRIYSAPAVIDMVMDRYAMTLALAGLGLPIPRTLSFESERGMLRALREVPSAVMKPIFTSKGRGMVRVGRDGDRFLADAWPVGDARVLLQSFIEAPGRDIGACVLGGRFIGAFYRVAQDGQWMTTTAAGGRYEPCQLSSPGIALAERVANVLGLDYTIVDLVESGGSFLIYEASAFGGFRGLWESARLDVAQDYARYVLAKQGAPQPIC
jgi:ribosomal protein S6--L-glutamate ligase